MEDIKINVKTMSNAPVIKINDYGKALNIKITPAQQSVSCPWSLITGDPSTNTALVLYINGKLLALDNSIQNNYISKSAGEILKNDLLTEMQKYAKVSFISEASQATDNNTIYFIQK